MENEAKIIFMKKRVLREDIKSYLIDAILRGVYKKDERLVETQIAKELGVSQAPVREAFRDLEQIGMLETVPFKGASVKGYSVQDVKNAYEVRAQLEGLAIRQAIKKMSDAEIEKLQSIYHKMMVASSTEDFREQVRLDVEFHEAIVKGSKNRILEIAWRSISAAHWTYFGIYKLDRSALVRRHESLLDALRNRDEHLATEYIQKHFLELKDMLNISADD